MNEFFKPLDQDKVLTFGFLFSFACIVFAFVLLLIFYRNLPPVVPLFNQLPWGDDRLGLKIQTFIPLGIALFTLLLNLFLGCFFYKESPLASRILTMASFSVSFFVFIFIIRLLQIMLL